MCKTDTGTIMSDMLGLGDAAREAAIADMERNDTRQMLDETHGVLGAGRDTNAHKADRHAKAAELTKARLAELQNDPEWTGRKMSKAQRKIYKMKAGARAFGTPRH